MQVQQESSQHEKTEVQIQIKKMGIITHNHSKIDTRETTTLNVQYRYALSLAVFDEICIGGILLLKWYEVDQYQTERVCNTRLSGFAIPVLMQVHIPGCDLFTRPTLVETWSSFYF